MTREARLRTALAINVVIVAVQVGFGIVAHSLGVLADAGHNLTDTVAVVLSLVAVRWATRAPTERRSFGYHRGAILAAQANAFGLLVVTAWIAYEAVRRLQDPTPVRGGIVVLAALAGFIGNAAAAVVLNERDRDLNMHSAWLHMVSDAAASLGVAIAGLVILFTGGNYWLDAAVSLVIGALVAIEAVRLLRQTVDVLFESTPRDLEPAELLRVMEGVRGVEQVHDLHVWGLTDDVRVLSAHVLVEGHPSLEQAQTVGLRVKQTIAERFGIAHATLELECEGCVDDGSWCAMDGTGAGTTTVDPVARLHQHSHRH
jgi:cobalt-zinc-cadmium efflux system protein